MKTEEELLFSQHLQINKLEERSKIIKDETKKIQATSAEHESQLIGMEAELSDMFTSLGIDIENSDLSNAHGIVELTEAEMEAIDRTFVIPPLEAIKYKDWASFVSDSYAFLRNEGIDPKKDPVFAMLSITDMAEVLQKYRNDYGEIFLDWKDYAVVLLAAVTGGLVNQFAPDRLKQCKVISGEDGKDILDKALVDWKAFATEQISTQVGFNIEELTDLKGFVLTRISSRIGLENDTLEEITVHFSKKLERGDKFSAIVDTMYVYQRLPKEWQIVADDWLAQRTGWAIGEVFSLQEFIATKVKSGNFRFTKDLINLYTMLPKTWQKFANEKILSRIGLSVSDIRKITDFLVKKIKGRKIRPFQDLITLMKVLPREWKQFLSSKLSEKIGFDISITEDIQKYLYERVRKNDFVLSRDAVEILKRFPEDWKTAIEHTISEKADFDVSIAADLQQYIAQRITEGEFDLVIDGTELLRRLPNEWLTPISRLISDRVGFDITAFHGIQDHILERIEENEVDYLRDGIEVFNRLPEGWKDFINRAISEKIGFDIAATSEIQKYILKKIQMPEFDLLDDIPNLFSRLPNEWQDFLKDEVSLKIGFDITILKDIQSFLITKIRKRHVDILQDSIELIQRLPEKWKGSINQKLSEKTGLDTKLIAYSMGPELSNLNKLRSNPAEFIAEQVKTYIGGNEQLRVLEKYVDMDSLAETIVLVINILREIFCADSEKNPNRLGEHFQKLLFAIIKMLEPSREQLFQIGGEAILNRIGPSVKFSEIYSIDDWIENSGMTLTIDELLEKLYTEDADLFSDEDVRNFGQLYSTIMKKSLETRSLSEDMERMFSSTPVVRSLLQNKASMRKLASFVEYAKTSTHATDSRELRTHGMVSEIINDIQKKLDILPKMMFQSGSEILCDPSLLGNWLYENGLSAQHLKNMGLTSAVIEIIIRGWYLASLYRDTGSFKKEPYAFKVSTMLASAHMLSNLPALAQIASGMPSTKLNFVSLGLGAKYGLSSIMEYAKREEQIQKDLNEKWTSIYNYSLSLLQP